MKRTLSTFLLLSLICALSGASYGKTGRSKRSKPTRATSAPSAPVRLSKPVAVLRSSELASGTRLTVSSDLPIEKYNTYQRDGRFYVRLMEVNSRIIEQSLRGRGFDDLQVEQQGADVLLSFRLQAEATATVSQKFNRLDINIKDGLAARMQSPKSPWTRNSATHANFSPSRVDAVTPVFPKPGQDQVETVNNPLELLPSTSGIDLNSAKIVGDAQVSPKISPNEAARALIRQTLFKDLGDDAAKKALDDPSFYCIVHVVKWRWNRQTFTKDPVVDAQNWYVYHKATKYEETGWGTKKFEGQRIYGSKNIGLLYIYLNVPAADRALVTADQALSDELRTRKVVRVKGGKSVVALGNLNSLIVQDYANVSYKVSVKKKLPAPLENAKTLLGILQAEAAEPRLEANQAVNLWGGRLMTLTPRPADVTVQAFLVALDGSQGETGKQTFDNEQRYHYDFSAGIPARGVKELQFNADNNTVGPRKIERQNVYAFFDVYPVAMDTKGLEFMKAPGLIFGLPIKGKPFDHPVLGINFGLNRVRLFGGVVFNRERAPQTLTTGDTATPNQLDADLTTRYVRKFIWGVNIPLRQVKEALK